MTGIAIGVDIDAMPEAAIRGEELVFSEKFECHHCHNKAPSLRNVAITAPYMHDGSIATLDGVLDHYASGGRTIVDGPDAGVGRDNPLKSSFVPGFEMTPEERAELIAFLRSLTDEKFLTDPRFSDPWKKEP